MSTEENEKKENRPRKVARSASTADHPAYKPGDPPPAAEALEGGAPPSAPKPERKWDVRAERPQGAGPRPARPARPRRPPGEGGPPGAGPRRPYAGGDPSELPSRRLGSSGGRASPELPRRGPVDRASAEFVDRWLTSKPKPPPDRRDRPFDRKGPPGEGAPPGSGPGGERRDPRSGAGGPPRPGAPRGAAAMHARQAVPTKPAPEKKLPTLHETILVGLPKVATHTPAERTAAKPKTAREAIAAKAAAAPKVAIEKAAPKGEVTLRPEWLGATDQSAVAMLVEAGDAGEKLVEAWTQANNAAAIVEAAHSDATPGAARKAAKRAINVLRARHVTIPERAVAKPAVASGEEEITEATFTPPDARGTISFTIARRQGGNRAHIAEVIVRENTGVLQAVSAWMSRSQIKEAHQRVADSSGIPPVVVSPDWARHRIAEAKKQNATSGALLPLSLEKCKELVEPVPAAAPPHPIADLEAKLGDDDGAAAKVALHVEPEFRSWLPDGQALDELLRKVGAAMTAEESQDSTKVDAVLKEEMKNATDRYFTPELRASVAGRMRDAAISVRQRAGEDKAREVLQVARAIEKAGLITSPPHEISFLHGFFEKGISYLAQRAGGQLRVPMQR
jgi:hypothetical protein